MRYLLLLFCALGLPLLTEASENQCSFLQSRNQAQCVSCLRLQNLGVNIPRERTDCSAARVAGVVSDQREIRGISPTPSSLCDSSWRYIEGVRSRFDNEISGVCTSLISAAGRPVLGQAGAQTQTARLSQESASPLRDLVQNLGREKESIKNRRVAHHQEMVAAINGAPQERRARLTSLLEASRNRDRDGFADENAFRRSQTEARSLYARGNPTAVGAFGHQLAAANALLRMQQQVEGEITRQNSTLAQLTGVGRIAADRDQSLGTGGATTSTRGNGLFDTNTLLSLAPLGLMAAGMMMQQKNNQQKSDVTSGANPDQNPNGGSGSQALPNRQIAGSSLGDADGKGRANGTNDVAIGSASSAGKGNGLQTGKGDAPIFGTIPSTSGGGPESSSTDSFKTDLGGFPFASQGGGGGGGASPSGGASSGGGAGNSKGDLESVIKSAGGTDATNSDGHMLSAGGGGGGGGYGGGGSAPAGSDGAFKDPFKTEGDPGALASAAFESFPPLDDSISALAKGENQRQASAGIQEGAEEQNRSLFSRVRDSHRRCLKRGCVTAGLSDKI
jgi:hypothetical protein